MEDLRAYVLTLILAAVLCAVIKKMLGDKGAVAAIVRILCGIFLVLALVEPLSGFVLPDWEDLTGPISLEAEEAIAIGENSSRKALESLISQQLETYIMDKAAQFDAGITVDIRLSEDTIPVPIGVTVTGNISPYGKRQLQSIIADNLGIAKENQVWKEGQQ